jgi:hypothetical protein
MDESANIKEIEAVTGPAEAPSDKPDSLTKQAIKESSPRKGKTLSIRADDLEEKLIADKDHQIMYHKDECQLLKQELDEVEDELKCQHDRVEYFIQRNTELEITNRTSGAMVFSSQACNIVASVLIGIAGLLKLNDPATEEKWKIMLGSTGTVLAVMAAYLYGLSWKYGAGKEKPRPPTHSRSTHS